MRGENVEPSGGRDKEAKKRGDCENGEGGGGWEGEGREAPAWLNIAGGNEWSPSLYTYPHALNLCTGAWLHRPKSATGTEGAGRELIKEKGSLDRILVDETGGRITGRERRGHENGAKSRQIMWETLLYKRLPRLMLDWTDTLSQGALLEDSAAS